MLGAIIPNAQEAWFFKLQGPDEEILGLMPSFINFTKSVSIKNGKVTWKAPDDWKEQAGGQFRVTTFLIPHGDQKPYELAVTRLDAADGVNDKYLQANLSRWRGQLGLEPIAIEDIPSLTTKVKFDGGSAWMVNFEGMPSLGNSMMPPMAGGEMPAGHPEVSAPEETEKPAAGNAAFDFTTPKGWSPGKPSAMRKASLAIAKDEMVADVSVFAFPAESNDLLSNVNRWRQQVGLKPVTKEELEKGVKKLDVSGESGDYVELVGEKETILGVMVKKGASAWFFKLQGPTVLALEERPQFEEFVKSSRLP
jgi:hypothetical protein